MSLRRIHIALAAAVLASAAFLAAPTAYAQTRSYTAGHFALEIDGVKAAYIKKFEGVTQIDSFAAAPKTKPAAPAKTLQSAPLKAPTLKKK